MNVIDCCCGPNDEYWYDFSELEDTNYNILRLDKENPENLSEITYWEFGQQIPIQNNTCGFFVCNMGLVNCEEHNMNHFVDEIKRIMITEKGVIHFHIKGRINEYSHFLELMYDRNIILDYVEIINCDIVGLDNEDKYISYWLRFVSYP